MKKYCNDINVKYKSNYKSIICLRVKILWKMMKRYLTANITHTSNIALIGKNVIVLNDKLLSENFSII